MCIRDRATEKWKENLTDQIKTEFSFGLIAEKENIKMDDDAFNSYVDYIVSASNGQFSKMCIRDRVCAVSKHVL